MPAVLNTNAASLYASKNLQSAQSKMAQSVERLSSGLRINRAKDDAAGLGISNALTTQINGANQGIRNLNDGISMVQTAEGAIAAAQEMAQRILTLATQGANGSMGTADRTAIKSEMKQLLTAIDAIGGRTKFSGNSLLNNDARSGTGNYEHANSAAPTSTKFTLQSSNQTSDTIALAANAFLNIGGFSTTAVGPITILGSAAASAGGQTTLTLVNTTGLVVGMAVTGTNVTAGTKIASIAGDGLSVVLDTVLGGTSAAGASIVFGGTTVNGTAVMALASGSNPPQTLVGTNVYKVIAATYTSIGTVTAVSGNNVTISASSAVTWAAGNAIAFSGQLTQVHSATTTDLSLSQSVASTTNDTADFQMVQRASEGYVKALSTQRSLLGAYQNQIEYTVSNVTELSANLDAARSNVQDTDYASETATLTKGQILQQAATAMLAQANQMPNVILSLLK
jgi:flagellin